MAEYSFPKSARLLNAEDYQAVFTHSRFKVSCRVFLLLAIPGSSSHSRLGIVVARKHVARAVQRNRLKRQIREWFRFFKSNKPVDLVVLVRKDADKLDNQLLSNKLESLGADLNRKLGTD